MAASFIIFGAVSVFFVVMGFVLQPFVNLACGALSMVWAVWIALFHAYEWTLREDGLLETRTLFRRRVERISRLEHDLDGNTKTWSIRRSGARPRIKVSDKSGHALANALRAQDASAPIDIQERQHRFPWLNKLADIFDGFSS
jgi:hypothetical protein